MDFADFNTVLELKKILINKGIEVYTKVTDEEMKKDYEYYLKEGNKEYARYNCFVAGKNEFRVFGIGNLDMLSCECMLNRVASVYNFKCGATHYGVIILFIDAKDNVCIEKNNKVNTIEELANIFK